MVASPLATEGSRHWFSSAGYNSQGNEIHQKKKEGSGIGDEAVELQEGDGRLLQNDWDAWAREAQEEDSS